MKTSKNLLDRLRQKYSKDISFPKTEAVEALYVLIWGRTVRCKYISSTNDTQHMLQLTKYLCNTSLYRMNGSCYYVVATPGSQDPEITVDW